MKRSQKTQVRKDRSQPLDRSQNVRALQLPQINPKTENQREFVDALKNNQLVIGAGPAGSGKTLLSVYHAARQLHYGSIKKIILIRAYQPLAGRSIGFLPGTAEEKLIPYYRQMLDYLEDFLGKAAVEIHMKRGSIEICSLETIRGRSWDYSCIVVDEAQSLYPQEVQALVTRIGEGSQLVLIGDNSGVQSDVKSKIDGLSYILGIIEKYKIKDAILTRFTYDDILRSDITRDFVIAFDKELQLSKVLQVPQKNSNKTSALTSKKEA